MPIYEYACKECEHSLDALQKIADAPLVDCPDCGKPGLKRLAVGAALPPQRPGLVRDGFQEGQSAQSARRQGLNEISQQASERQQAEIEAVVRQSIQDGMMKRLRRYLVAGLLVWLPLGITVFLFRILIGLMDKSLVLDPAAIPSGGIAGRIGSRPRRNTDDRLVVAHGRPHGEYRRPQFFGWLGILDGSDSCCAIHLFGGQEFRGNRVLRFGQGVQQGFAGRVSAQGAIHLDLSDGVRRWRDTGTHG